MAVPAYSTPAPTFQFPAGSSRRAAIENQIERLILLLDLFDPDPDLEPWLAGPQTSVLLDVEQSCEGEGEQDDREPNGDEDEGDDSGIGDVDGYFEQTGGPVAGRGLMMIEEDVEAAHAATKRLSAIIARISGLAVCK